MAIALSGVSHNSAPQAASSLKEAALKYHAEPAPGKIATSITKNPNDLRLAYSPGVAEPVKVIKINPAEAYRYTNKGNLVSVISNGSATLGLGNTGPLAFLPVGEGKSLLFKHFAGIDSFPILINESNPDKMVQIIKAISPTFGGINLEDIKAPECFEVESKLIEQCDIPVFHDDQHGTAIVLGAGLLNALDIQGKKLEEAKIVCLGAGAAGIASLRLLHSMGVPKENITLLDSKGVIHDKRQDLNRYKAEFAQSSNIKARTLEEAIKGADVFIGLAQANLLKPEMLKSMAEKPVVFALSNPDPEIHPDVAKATRSDVIIATGRSDYPNQVNNVLAFPYIFKAALNCRASKINEEMKIAAVQALRAAAQLEKSSFGSDYIIPKPTDPRLKDMVTKAVQDAAEKSGVARKPATEDAPATAKAPIAAAAA